MAITVIEQLNGFITDLMEALERKENELQNSDPQDVKVEYLQQEIPRLKDRLEFFISLRDEEQASGKIRYVYDFGSPEFFRQDFDGVKCLQDKFISLTQRTLEAAVKPKEKVKYMENLMKAYNEAAEQKSSRNRE